MYKALLVTLLFLSATLHSDMYPTNQKTKKFLLITGCGRSGTQYMFDYLNASGLKVGHELMKDHGLVSWLMTSTAAWVPWGPIPSDYEFEYTFHQTRNPLKVIESYYNVPPEATWEWIRATVTEIQMNDPDIIKCAKYWYYWNLLAERKSDWTYRIEDFDVLYLELGRRIGIEFSKEILDTIPKNANTKVKPHHKKITWKVLHAELPEDLYQKVVWLAKKYGYSTSDPS